MAHTFVIDFLPPDHPFVKDAPELKPEYITIHETANFNKGADAEMHGKYLKSQEAISRQVSWHFTVSDKEIRQHLPLNLVAWHAGDGYNGNGNRKSIAIEMCVNEDGNFEETLKITALLIKDLYDTIPTLKPFPEGVVQHNKWSGKNCPMTLRGRNNGWDDFLLLVMDVLKPKWSPVDEIEKLMRRGIITSTHDPKGMVSWAEFATVINRVLDRIKV